ncbi:hypothetical protein PILCRDRAFT_822591 [Piloderma croceum F 1598]|uniref:Uncharacterized protein n=1 Tax=Piloderma croceum (strain F 1598) TaxID=765440 RepID=A0A0C3B2Q3_PILCF|nr:hypothetical protein PILCRDRAFT_822591 [Piloderma croceum F 1598]
MSMLANVVGFSLFGLAARMGQLGIQRRNPMENLAGHAIAMSVFGYVGYWAYRWDARAATLLGEKRAEIAERRERSLAAAEEADS